MQKELDRQDIEIYVATLYNSPYVSYNYTLDYDSIKIDKETATVQLRESNEVVIKLSSEPSKMGNLQHIFTLNNQEGRWVIYKDEYQDELSQGLALQTKEELLQQLDENYQKSKQQSSNSTMNTLENTVAQPLGLTTYSYSGSSARSYAAQYWNTTNPPYYIGLSSDCTNFVSQCIYKGEGKTPPDTSGMANPNNGDYYNDWYYVWNNSGSVPWINVGNQYTFITGNTSRIGPYGSSTASFCNARVGDVVQLQSASGWFHEGIIVGKDNPCYGPQSLYAAAHTTNRWNYNLYNWTMYAMRFIRINGWRGN
ncbi:MAG: amidase domain-containing protein [Anaerolineales bacterium]|nr:amidase domain-containing protein [Anaerolineales bacterium]